MRSPVDQERAFKTSMVNEEPLALTRINNAEFGPRYANSVE